MSSTYNDTFSKAVNKCPEISSGIKADGLLTAMCRTALREEIPHSFTIESAHPEYDIIIFLYTLAGEERRLVWMEERSFKSYGEQEVCGIEVFGRH